MAPKNKGKKGKKQDDDDFWDKAGTSVAGNNADSAIDAGAASDDDSKSKGKGKSTLSAFAALSLEEPPAAEEDEDFGGLMSVIKASNKKGKKEKADKKKDKKKGGAADDNGSVSFADGPDPGEGSEGEEAAAKGDISAPQKAVQMTAEELADEEWGPVKEKGKKAKKGKKKGKTQDDENDEEKLDAPSSRVEATPSPAPESKADEDGDGAEDGGPKILSKKEKEKLKKEREKARMSSAAKKVGGEDAASPESAAAPSPSAPAEGEDDDEGDGGVEGESKKKKKKKKAKKDEEPTAPAPAAKKKGPSGISALKALMEEKRRIEEETRMKIEEERKRIEEEERRIEEEEKRKEEEKQRRKEKEKAKREQLKKEGKLLTKKQKEDQRAAELRRQALLASGVQIEGLQQGSAEQRSKRVVYDNRKKKKGPTSAASGSHPGTRDPSPVREKTSAPEPTPAPATPEPQPESPVEKGDIKDSWDASSDEEGKADGVKDSWDASSDDEQETAKPAAKTPPSNGSAKAVAKEPVSAKSKPPAAPAKTASSAKAAPANADPTKPLIPPTKVTGVPANGGAKAKPKQEDSSSSDESSEEESSDEETSSDEDSSDDSDAELTQTQRMAAQRKAEAAIRRQKAHEDALAARSKDNLRSPICCILGHVDTGKTKLLDKIRQTNVQEGEAGGITQQIGATYFPVEAIKTKTAVMNRDGSQEYKIPGLLVIDTPGHESFTNLRSRGSSLCNIAILVVDIMHGLEPQTLESLRLLRDRKSPFIVALNKIDRIYGWEPTPDNDFRSSLAKQKRAVQRQFEDMTQKITVAFAEQGLNAVLYYDNKNFARNVSIVPTSAVTGEGVPDMIMLLVNLTQQRMSDRLMYLSELECTVLEVKVIEGLGTTIDVVLSNGILHEGDKIVVCGLNGPIVTQIRALLTPQPLRELRIKSQYVHHKEVKAALGVKLVAPDLEKAIAGSRLLVCGPDDDEDDLMEEVMSDLTTLLNSIDKSGRGVCVQASTLGSLEALLEFLRTSKIPVSGINIGPVHKKDIMRAATMLEKAKELACILCFDVTVDKDAERLAEEMGIRLFKADIIYHLFDAFTAYNQEIMEAKRKDAAPQAVWPCRLKTIAAFCKRDPIILGVDILDGTLRVGTPICVVKVDPETQKKEIIDLGRITSLEINHKAYEIVKKSQAGAGVAVKIEHAVYQSAKMFGRHFDEKDELYSHITRQSIDVLKSSFKTDVTNEEWLLIKALKPMSAEHEASNHSTKYADAESSSVSVIDEDELKLRKLGYKQVGPRDHSPEASLSVLAAFNRYIRSGFFLGLLAGGPAAIWSSYLISMFFMFITAAVLAEICSALPLSGSIYIWSAESAGPKYARFFGFIVAWWSTTAWMTFAAGNCQLAVWEIDFPGGIGNDNVKWRALIWAVSEGVLLVAVAINYLPPRWYSFIFKFSVALYGLDFLLCVIWLPIGVHRTYGFRSAKDVFTMTYNGTGAPAGWNWILSFLFTAGTMIGFDASGHIAEETKNASVVAGRGIISSVIATGVLGFATTILFLFCTPDLDTLFALEAPQPFVQIYALALGKGPSIFMTVIATVGLILSTSVAIVAASRLIFAVARDGVLPLSGWIGKVDSQRQPRNAVTIMFVFGALILCTILPSQVAFTSLVSAGGIPTTAAYGLIALLRLTMTPNDFKGSHFYLGRWRKPFYIAAVLFNALVFAVQISPFMFPTDAQTFNFSCVILGAATIFGVLSWYIVPEDKWLRREQVEQQLRVADEPLEAEEPRPSTSSYDRAAFATAKRTD
ncbi:hypothetical protein BC628DRAFT_1337291 [Trametes gibbosa]|nr:hypothetical protein BC628DRAFT_1337291 [Trametes gibbosa]